MAAEGPVEVAIAGAPTWANRRCSTAWRPGALARVSKTPGGPAGSSSMTSASLAWNR